MSRENPVQAVQRAWGRRVEPVIVDNRIELLTAYLWGCYACWGLASLHHGAPILKTSVSFYPVIWGGLIGCFALLAFLCVVTKSFIPSSHVAYRVRLKRIEMGAVIMLTSFVLLYPGLMWASVFMGTPERLAAAFLSLTYFAYPAWRIRHLFTRIKALRKVQG